MKFDFTKYLIFMGVVVICGTIAEVSSQRFKKQEVEKSNIEYTMRENERLTEKVIQLENELKEMKNHKKDMILTVE